MFLPTWSLVTVSLLWSLVCADPIHIPIVRRTKALQLDDYAQAADRLRLKYGYSPVSKRKRQNSAGVSLINQNSDTSYLATVSIGTAQTFNVVLDTGSSDLWVVDSACALCNASTLGFTKSRSSSFQQVTSNGQTVPVSITYGLGNVAGTLVKDTVSLGGFQVAQQPWILVESTSQNLLQGSNTGIMGLAFTALASTGATPFWESLASSNALSTPEMSFWMNRLLNVSNQPTETFGGIFTLGGTNSSLYQGTIEYLNIVSSPPSYWLLDVSQVTVQGKTISIPTGNSATAAIDTGTTLIGAPTAVVTAVYAAIPGSSALGGSLLGYYQYPCNTKISISISFGGNLWPINPVDMNLGQISRTNMCLGGIFDLHTGSALPSGSGNPSWVVGDTFLKNVYSVFRYGSSPAVGFAQLATGSSGPPISGSGTLTGVQSTSTSTPLSSGAASMNVPTVLSLFASALVLVWVR